MTTEELQNIYYLSSDMVFISAVNPVSNQPFKTIPGPQEYKAARKTAVPTQKKKVF